MTRYEIVNASDTALEDIAYGWGSNDADSDLAQAELARRIDRRMRRYAPRVSTRGLGAGDYEIAHARSL